MERSEIKDEPKLEKCPVDIFPGERLAKDGKTRGTKTFITCAMEGVLNQYVEQSRHADENNIFWKDSSFRWNDGLFSLE